MKAVLRAGAVFMAVALAAPATALAQTAPTPTPSPTPSPTTNSTTPVTVGPGELQNFSLKGTVTRQADEPPVVTPSRPQTAPVRPPVLGPSGSRSVQTRTTDRTVSTTTGAPRSIATTSLIPPGLGTSSVTPAPVSQQSVVASPGPMPDSFAPAEDSSDRGPKLGLWPWIAAALALAAAAGFLLWRRSQREPVLASGEYDLLERAAPAPEPQPLPPGVQRPLAPIAPPPVTPAPRPEPEPAPIFSWRPSPTPAGDVTTKVKSPVSTGIVASNLRPTLELGFHPIRCQVDDNEVVVEFELELFNTGTAPARAVFAEASLLNASAQESEISAFFANAHGTGEPLDIILPMKRVSFRSQVVAPRSAVQEFELAGRKTFVPVIAFNALYEWSGGKGQSSVAYLVGRDTRQDKLGPLRLDQGSREFSELAARPLPSVLRT